MIKIKWDQKNHNWSGEPDKWTFESHFEVLNDGTDINADSKYIDNLRDASDSALTGIGFFTLVIKDIPSLSGQAIIAETFAASLDPMVKEFIEQYIIDMAEEIVSKQLEEDDDV
jgi:hypothetical protein